MDGRALMDLARALAVVKHAGIYRRDTGEPYFNHVQRVADRCYGWRQKTIAYLHDLVEDTSVTADDLRKLFPEDIVQAVEALTRQVAGTRPETYAEFIERIAVNRDRDVIPVKLADIYDNREDTSGLSPEEAKSLRQRYTRAEAVLIEAADRHDTR